MKYALILIFALAMTSCQGPFNQKDLIGRWKTISWTELPSEKVINHSMNFDFKSDGLYTIDYGSYLEEGKYWVDADKLYTQEQNKAKKKVRILKLTPEEFTMEMNRSGNIEVVVLGRYPYLIEKTFGCPLG